jgi:hypothetical protein
MVLLYSEYNGSLHLEHCSAVNSGTTHIKDRANWLEHSGTSKHFILGWAGLFKCLAYEKSNCLAYAKKPKNQSHEGAGCC